MFTYSCGNLQTCCCFRSGCRYPAGLFYWIQKYGSGTSKSLAPVKRTVVATREAPLHPSAWPPLVYILLAVEDINIAYMYHCKLL